MKLYFIKKHYGKAKQIKKRVFKFTHISLDWAIAPFCITSKYKNGQIQLHRLTHVTLDVIYLTTFVSISNWPRQQYVGPTTYPPTWTLTQTLEPPLLCSYTSY